MSTEDLKATEPKYTKCHATEHGWVETKSGELMVAIKDLKNRLGLPAKRGPGRPRKIRPE